MNEIKEQLEQIAQYFSMSDGFNGYMTKYRVDIVLKHCKGKSLLDIGSADAFMAEALSPFFEKIVSIDGSEKLIEKAKQRLANKNHNIEFVCSLVEEYKTEQKFDTVLLSFILEHLENPITVLKQVRNFVAKDGTIFIMVPNALSLHRRLGKQLGLIKDHDSLNEVDVKQGHCRVYTPNLLLEHVKESGLSVIESGTFFIKPFSNPQMELIDRKICDGLYEISHELQGLGSMIYLKAK